MSQLLCLILTDTHLSSNNIELNISVYKQAIKIAKANNLEVIFHAGDVFDSRKAQTLDVLFAFSTILDIFKNEGIKLIAIPGNHDKTNYCSDLSFLHPFNHHPAFELISYAVSRYLSNNFNIVLIPYYDEEKMYYEIIKESHQLLDEDIDSILLTHIAINGIKNNDGSCVENSINIDLFDNFEKVLIGHYHNYCKVNDKITYIGSPFQHNFGENQDKKLFALDKDLNEVRFDLQTPVYQTIIIEITNNIYDIIDKVIKEKEENVKLRLIIKGTIEQINTFKSDKYKREGIDIKFESNAIEMKNNFNQIEFINFNKSSILKEFKVFCNENNIQNNKSGQNYLNTIFNLK